MAWSWRPWADQEAARDSRYRVFLGSRRTAWSRSAISWLRLCLAPQAWARQAYALAEFGSSCDRPGEVGDRPVVLFLIEQGQAAIQQLRDGLRLGVGRFLRIVRE